MRRAIAYGLEFGAEMCTTEWTLLPAVHVYWRDRESWMLSAHFLCFVAWVGSP